MIKLLGLAFIVIGGILLYYGYNERTSPVGEITEALTGSPPDQSLAKLIGGVALIAVGAGSLFYRRK